MANHNLTSAQLSACLLSSMVASCITNIAPFFYKNFGQNTWLIMLLVTLISFALIFIVYRTCKSTDYLYPETLCQELFGKFLGKTLSFLLFLYLLLLASLCMRTFIFIVNGIYLPKTPLFVTGILLILPCLYITFGGLRVLGHTSLVLYLLILGFLGLFVVTKTNYIYTNLFPLVNENLFIQISAIPQAMVTSSAILGSFFLLPFVVDRQKIKKHLLLFIFLSCGLMLLVYAIGRTYFGETLANLSLPFFNLTSRYNYLLLERLDVFYILLYVPVAGLFTTYFFVIMHGFQEHLFPEANEKHRGLIIIILAVVVLTISLAAIPKNKIWVIFYLANIGNEIVIALLLIVYWLFILKRRIG